MGRSFEREDVAPFPPESFIAAAAAHGRVPALHRQSPPALNTVSAQGVRMDLARSVLVTIRERRCVFAPIATTKAGALQDRSYSSCTP